MVINNSQDVCECGHKLGEHCEFNPHQCYKFVRRNGCTYECICKTFKLDAKRVKTEWV